MNIIEIENMNLKYKLVLKREFKSIFKNVLNRSNRVNKIREVHALRDINLSIGKGKKVGIIGSNGAGKSTLLRTIAQVFEPDSGTVNVFTDSVSLLALGVGFENELSGYENIYLSGLLLGFSKKVLDKNIQEIVDFSELGDFIEAPVRAYSSGMKSRLSFSIVASLEPELLLIDEIFSVGDASFKKKSEKKMLELIEHDRTVVMVSHNMKQISKLCDEVIWLEKGQVKLIGDTKEVLRKYKESSI